MHTCFDFHTVGPRWLTHCTDYPASYGSEPANYIGSVSEEWDWRSIPWPWHGVRANGAPLAPLWFTRLINGLHERTATYSTALHSPIIDQIWSYMSVEDLAAMSAWSRAIKNDIAKDEDTHRIFLASETTRGPFEVSRDEMLLRKLIMNFVGGHGLRHITNSLLDMPPVYVPPTVRPSRPATARDFGHVSYDEDDDSGHIPPRKRARRGSI